ncbi:MAG: outer membrane beta-barrel protein [Lentimicrobiaceae bacterium]|nr:outer membrane beta-barrel protein [Lentimicrobiaceae bacterium]
MKNHLKVMSVVLMSFFGLLASVNAQELSFGIRAGFDMQNINGKDNEGDNLENKLLPGFNAGINVEIPVAPDFVLQPGLLFTTKGAKVAEINAYKVEGSANLHLSYIELPINFIYKPLLGSGHLLLGFGPYLAMALVESINSMESGDHWNIMKIGMYCSKMK